MEIKIKKPKSKLCITLDQDAIQKLKELYGPDLNVSDLLNKLLLQFLSNINK